MGGTADAALRRPSATPTAGSRCLLHRRWPRRLSTAFAKFAFDAGRAVPNVTGSIVVALDGDPALPALDEIVGLLADPNGVYGMPTEAIPSTLVTGGADAVAAHVDGWANLGAERVVFTIAAGDWHQQIELLASAVQDWTVRSLHHHD